MNAGITTTLRLRPHPSLPSSAASCPKVNQVHTLGTVGGLANHSVQPQRLIQKLPMLRENASRSLDLRHRLKILSTANSGRTYCG